MNIQTRVVVISHNPENWKRVARFLDEQTWDYEYGTRNDFEYLFTLKIRNTPVDKVSDYFKNKIPLFTDCTVLISETEREKLVVMYNGRGWTSRRI